MTQRSESVSFDRAAGFYDATRRHSAQVSAAQTDALLQALQDVDDPTLEIGVGTGRVALPLVAAGRRLVGVDLSSAMLAALRDKSPRALPLVRADATRLPFHDDAFGAAVAAHVLHLVADWRAVIAELRRVVRPGGTLLVTRGASSGGLQAEIQRRVRDFAGVTFPSSRLDDPAVLDDYIAAVGGAVTVLPDIPTDESFTADERIRAIEANIYSWTWEMPDETRLAAAGAVREWVTRTYGDPASVQIPSPPVRWRRYRLPG
jgi:SAM-dependent methyltransferase